MKIRVLTLIATLAWIVQIWAPVAARADEASPLPPLASRPRVLLITSMKLPDLSKVPKRYRSYFTDEKFRIETTFREAFHDVPVDVWVIHDANAYDTWRALKSPGNIAVFWFSHAGTGGAMGGDILQDVTGSNVLPIFQALHPDTQVLSLIGCDTQKIYPRLQERGFFKANPSIELVGAPPLVEATYGFDQALKQAVPLVRKALAGSANTAALAAENSDACAAPQRGYSITLRRDIDPTLSRDTLAPAVIVTMAGKLMTVFPPAHAGEGEDRTIVWRNTTDRAYPLASDLKINFDAGEPAMQDSRWLGDFEISGSWKDAEWKPFAKPGTNYPMGVSSHVYHYAGPLDFADHQPPESVAPSDCESIHPAALADVTPGLREHFGQPRVAVGAGTATGTGGLGAGQPIWARISIAGVDGRLQQLALIYGQVSAEGIVHLDPAAAGGRLPYLDLHFTAITAGRTDHDGENVGLRLGSVAISRDMPLDERRVIRVDLLGLQSRIDTPFKHEFDPSTIAYLNVAADMLGYESALRMREGSDFHGLDLAAAETEVGLEKKLGDHVRMHVALGLDSDVAVSPSLHGSWHPGLLTQFKAYSQVRADLDQLAGQYRLSAFAELSAPLVMETGEQTEDELRMIGGLMVAH